MNREARQVGFGTERDGKDDFNLCISIMPVTNMATLRNLVFHKSN
jgi:hypothetical protein